MIEVIMNKRTIKEFLKPDKLKIIIMVLPLIISLLLFHPFAYKFGVGCRIDFSSYYLGFLLSIIIFWYFLACIYSYKKNLKLLLLIMLIILLTFTYIFNLPSWIIHLSVKGLPCESKEYCWSICEERCEYDFLDKIRYHRPSSPIPTNGVLAIGNCENGTCTGCDCCWGCKI